MAKELYSRLGLAETASEKEIESAYRSLSAECSPESGHNDDESVRRFAYLTEAYTVLSDMNARAEYDIRGTVRNRKGRKGSGKSSTMSIVRTREVLNRIFLCGAAVSVVLYIIHLAGGSAVPFFCVCGLSLCIKIVEYILRLIQ